MIVIVIVIVIVIAIVIVMLIYDVVIADGPGFRSGKNVAVDRRER